jgi:hypothetical protein
VVESGNEIALTFKVKEPCSPQKVAVGDEGLAKETVVAISEAVELIDILDVKVESDTLLAKVVNVRIDEVGVEDVRIDGGTIDSVHVSSTGDSELAVVRWIEVVNVDNAINVDSYMVGGEIDEDELTLVS